MFSKNFTCLGLVVLFIGCNREDQTRSVSGGWLKGNPDEKFSTIANQFRGFDATMAEMGYRYIELYWAGRDGNWEYAGYQTKNIKSALTHGLERRPKKASSSQIFLEQTLPQMSETIASKDSAVFMERFDQFTQSCNACHVMEKVEFIKIKPPLHRISPAH